MLRAAHGWTPGQHAILRGLVGIALALHALLGAQLHAAQPWFALPALLYASGRFETLAAALTGAGLALLGARTQDPWTFGLALTLLMRVPPRRELGLGPAPFFGFTWLLLAAASAASGVWHWREAAHVFAVFEFVCAALAFAPPLRPAVWSAACVAQAGWALAGRGLPPESAPLLLLAFAFDPAWIRARRPAAPHTVYYDGACGLCHASVRLLLREDRDGAAFRYAPLQGGRFARAVPAATRATLPDSIVLQTADGRLRARSAALLEMGAALGGLWRLLAAFARLVPRPLRDAAYDGVARVRGRLFRKPDALCPLLPPDWARRFDLD